MVEADVGDEAQVRMNDIGAIQSPAQPDFDDGYVDLLTGK